MMASDQLSSPPSLPVGLEVFLQEVDQHYQATCAAVRQPNSFDIIGTETSTWKPLVNEKGVVSLESQFTPKGVPHDPFSAVRRTLLVLFDPEREGFGAFRQSVSHECLEGWMPASRVTLQTERHSWLRELALVDEEDNLHIKVEIPGEERFYTIPLPKSQRQEDLWGHPLPPPTPRQDGTAFAAALASLEKHWRAVFAALLAWPFPHAFLKRGILAGLAKALVTQYDGALRYGATRYYCDDGKCAESFPPTVFTFAEAALFYGLEAEAKRHLGHFLESFVTSDGEILHRGNGASLSEHGMLLELFARCRRHTGDADFQKRHAPVIQAVVDRLLTLIRTAGDSLLLGCPEDDLRNAPHRRWFSCNLWVARGLLEHQRQFGGLDDSEIARFAARCLSQCRAATVACTDGLAFVPPCVEPCPPFADMNDFVEVAPGDDIHSLASYTNYRLYPEMLSSGLLSPETAKKILAFRRARSGDFHGATTFRLFRDYPPYAKCLDNWPVYHLLKGLLHYGEWQEAARILAGHLALHQSRTTFFAPEMTFQERLDSTHCTPAQLAVPLAIRYLWGQWPAINKPQAKA